MNKLYKTRLCDDWETFGECKYESNCRYAHGNDELRLVVCRYNENCHNKSCKFVHTNKEEKKNDINLYCNLEINKDKNKILNYYIKELKKHIKICEDNEDIICNLLGASLKKELINIKILND